MKTEKTAIGFYAFLILSISFSCGGENTGGLWTEIDSADDQLVILQPEQIHEPSDTDNINNETRSIAQKTNFVTENAVQAKMQEIEDFNWEDFRTKLAAQEEAIGEGFYKEDDEIATAWQSFNDKYDYRTVYTHYDGNLWLQTYYRDNSSAAGQASDEKGQLLTAEDRNDPAFKDLWSRMEENAKDPFK